MTVAKGEQSIATVKRGDTQFVASVKVVHRNA